MAHCTCEEGGAEGRIRNVLAEAATWGKQFSAGHPDGDTGRTLDWTIGLAAAGLAGAGVTGLYRSDGGGVGGGGHRTDGREAEGGRLDEGGGAHTALGEGGGEVILNIKGMVHLIYKLYLKAVFLCVKFNGAIGFF